MAEILAMKRAEADRQPAGPVWTRLEKRVLRVTLANPPANALSLTTMRALQEALDDARDDEAVRVVVIAASGGLFCAGHDLKEMTSRRGDEDSGRAFFEETFATCSRLMQGIVGHPKPVIAEVDGIATAAGCQLVASCDLAIATDKSTFGVNGIDVGLFCTTPGVALARGMKPKHAMEMLLTGEMIDASQAREFGLINRVVPREYLVQVVTKYAEAIAAKPASAIRLGKEAFYAQAQMSLADAYDYASRKIVENMMFGAVKEGIGAFLGKRKPEWTE